MEYVYLAIAVAIVFLFVFGGFKDILDAWHDGKGRVEQKKTEQAVEATKQEQLRLERAKVEQDTKRIGHESDTRQLS
jgi:hypothetical protein